MSIKLDSENLKEGLLGLVIAIVEILKEILQRQAIYRIESGSLRQQEAEQLGIAFQKLDEAIEKIKKENNLERVSDQILMQLDNAVDDTLNKMINQEDWEIFMEKQDVKTL